MGDETEITAPMIDAGVRVLWRSGLVDGQVEADKVTVAEIYRAMCRAHLASSACQETPGKHPKTGQGTDTFC